MYRDRDLIPAIVMLHEQAHGNNSIRTCTEEPCRNLDINWQGPAPLTLAGVERVTR